MTTAHRPPRLLVVDDDEDVRELVAVTLRQAGYLPQTACSGEQALQQARQLSPDLVISDVCMPGLSGLQVCQTLKSDSQTRDTAVLLVSGRSSQADLDAGARAGADDYLAKPIQPAELLRRVALLLAGRTARGAA